MSSDMHFPIATNVFNICVDEKDPIKTSGRLFHCYSQNPITFNEIGQLLFSIDNLCEETNFPQASTQSRVFNKKSYSGTSRKELVQVMTSKDIVEQKGSKGTFVVQVQYRQNATWQGTVVWAEKNVTKNFRSALELLKLIDNALDEGNPPQE